VDRDHVLAAISGIEVAVRSLTAETFGNNNFLKQNVLVK
jgi:hypothetical protein